MLLGTQARERRSRRGWGPRGGSYNIADHVGHKSRRSRGGGIIESHVYHSIR